MFTSEHTELLMHGGMLQQKVWLQLSGPSRRIYGSVLEVKGPIRCQTRQCQGEARYRQQHGRIGHTAKWYCAKCLQSWLEWNPDYTIVDTPDHIPLSNETIARTGLRQWNDSYIATCEHQGHIFAIMEVTWQITSQTHGFLAEDSRYPKQSTTGHLQPTWDTLKKD